MRVAVADDTYLFRESFCLLLEHMGIEVSHRAANGADIVAAVVKDPPDVVILDIRMPPGETGGLDAAERLRGEFPDLPVLALSLYVQPVYVQRLLTPGARFTGYRQKDRVADATALRECLDRLVSGETVIEPDMVSMLLRRRSPARSPLAQLTPMEMLVLKLMAEGFSNRRIAEQLKISVRAVEGRVGAIFAKLHLSADALDQDRRVMAVLTFLRETGQRDE
ncbi:DNA-binding response regulator [Paractinoplanes deccanensis]|uniref:DNA-binding response regulator n=1 Tax=Paractinoplanes deccanensis TaxID=113561 RepID=A0ABQ3YGY0_9ACTN|nr:response regulator transcription factor [Actinoplanes deccanensis]GID79265.1 DNA-binding response regulator [Actinoplanes deccanensis]